MEFRWNSIEFFYLLSWIFQVNLFEIYREISIFFFSRVSIRTRILFQNLINYNPTKDKPIFAQDSRQSKHCQSNDIDDFNSTRKLLASIPDVPEM